MGVGGPTMFSNMERTKFGDIQARLFPKMGMACMSMSGLGIASYLHSHSPGTALYLLATSLLINAVNSFIVFPVCTGYMYERRKHEEGSEEQKKASMILESLTEFLILSTLDPSLPTWLIFTSWQRGLPKLGRE